MDGGITRQSEQYGIFDNTPKPERTAREAAPESVIREYTRGRSVGDGQLNPRGIRRQHFAGWHTPDFDPRVDMGPGDYDDRPSASDFYGEGDYHYDEDEFEDLGYKEPPVGEHGDPGFAEDELRGELRGRPHPFGTPTYNPRSSPYSDHPPSFNEARRHTADDGGLGGQLFTHMFTPGSRVGLPYNGQLIPGIVHQLHPDSEVGVRWSDGQYTKESPGDIQPL